jgi:hypothetical protein
MATAVGTLDEHQTGSFKNIIAARLLRKKESLPAQRAIPPTRKKAGDGKTLKRY